MHSLKITHTDLKPENILMTSTGLVKRRVNYFIKSIEVNQVVTLLKNVRSLLISNQFFFYSFYFIFKILNNIIFFFTNYLFICIYNIYMYIYLIN